jgi:hypothetical protein
VTTKRNERLREREAGLHRAIEEAKGVLRASHARFRVKLGKDTRSSSRRRRGELLRKASIKALERETRRVKERIEGKPRAAAGGAT